MDVEKILRKSAEEVRHVHSKYPKDTSQLEQQIYEKIHRGKHQRISRFVYTAVSAVLIMVITLIVPVMIDPPQQKDSNQRASLQENYTIDVNQTFSYSDIKDSPIEQFMLKKIHINQYNVEVVFQITTKDSYVSSGGLINPYLTDENGREFYWNNKGIRKGMEDTLTFIPIGKYESPPKKITLHFDGFEYSRKGSIGKFTVSLSEAYPQEITLDEHTLTIEKVKYDERDSELNIRFANVQKGVFRHLYFRAVGSTEGRGGGNDKYFSFNPSVPKKETYTIEVFSWFHSFLKQTAIEIDIPLP